MQSGLRPSQQGKEAPTARTGGTLLGSKLRSIWDGPFIITNVFPYGAVELKDENTNSTFQVNGYHLKEFHELPTSRVAYYKPKARKP
ncbi:hypothetical protein CR513_22016, partial [Mucuna pruriens]